MRTVTLRVPDTLQGKTGTLQGDNQILPNWDLVNDDAFAILMVFSDLFWLLFKCVLNQTKAMVCRRMGREGGLSGVCEFIPRVYRHPKCASLQTDRFSLGAIKGDSFLRPGLKIKERTGFCRQGDENSPSVLADVCFSLQLQSLMGCVFIQI